MERPVLEYTPVCYLLLRRARVTIARISAFRLELVEEIWFNEAILIDEGSHRAKLVATKEEQMHSRIVLLVVSLLVPGAQAALLDLMLLPAPDVTSAFIQVDYHAASHTFAANGFALTLETPPAEPPPDYDIVDGGFAIDLDLGPTGGLLGGSLVIGGSVAEIGAGSPLLTGTASAFGYMDSPGGSMFDFTFIVTGGSLAGPGFYPLGSQVGVILDAVTPFSGSFAPNYANAGAGTSDTAPLVPEPAALALLLLGLAALRRR